MGRELNHNETAVRTTEPDLDRILSVRVDNHSETLLAANEEEMGRELNHNETLVAGYGPEQADPSACWFGRNLNHNETVVSTVERGR